MKDMLRCRGIEKQFEISSAATSTEEIGNPVHYGTREKLAKAGISVAGKTAVQMCMADYNYYDYLIGMDSSNLSRMRKIAGGDRKGKMYRLLDFTDNPRDIADPWYTGDFETTYTQVCEGCEALLQHILLQR